MLLKNTIIAIGFAGLVGLVYCNDLRIECDSRARDLKHSIEMHNQTEKVDEYNSFASAARHATNAQMLSGIALVLAGYTYSRLYRGR